jgi:hypothetical protein
LDEVVGPDLREEDFWSAADRSRPGLRAKIRRRRAKDDGRRVREAAPATVAPAAARHAKPSLRARAAAAWASEMAAMRALRSRPVGNGAAAAVPSTTDRRRKTFVMVGAGVAAVALLVAIGDAALRDGPPRQEAAGASADDGTELVSTGSGSASSDDVSDTVPSQIIDGPSAAPPKKVPRASKPAAAPAKATTTTAAPRPASPPTPPPARPTPAPAAPPTTAPRPTVPPTPPTTAPRPAAPKVDQFTATVASSPGGACAPLQWATTFRWATTNASTVAITGLLEPTQSNLSADGSKVVCRAIPTAPLGGWTLTATGPGGSSTATA